MRRVSRTDLLVLHAVRVLGFADTPTIAHRVTADAEAVTEVLLDAEARGWVQHAAFADLQGWSLTERGRTENERQLAAELADAGGAEEVRAVHHDFLPLNGRLRQACTDWQLRPGPDGRLAENDHSDHAWDARVLAELAEIDRALAPLVGRLGGVLERFGGYETRFAAALDRARAGDGRWVTGTDVDSCHRVWFELHEDLVATLGLDRQAEP